MIDDIKDFKPDIDFNELLRETFIMACSIARDTAIEILTHVDKMIRENVNSKRYEFKKMVEKTILTPTPGANAVAKSLSLLHSEGGDQKICMIVYSKEIGFIANGYIGKVLRDKLNENKREVSGAVRDIMRENNRKRKYGGINSHIEV